LFQTEKSYLSGVTSVDNSILSLQFVSNSFLALRSCSSSNQII